MAAASPRVSSPMPSSGTSASFDAFKKQMTQAAATNMGSGWAALVWDPLSSRLLTAQIHDHQSETLMGSVPLMVIDAWEHAYYLQYQNEKAKFFDAIWNVWNWDDIAERFAEAQKLNLRWMRPRRATPRRRLRPPQAPGHGRASDTQTRKPSIAGRLERPERRGDRAS